MASAVGSLMSFFTGDASKKKPSLSSLSNEELNSLVSEAQAEQASRMKKVKDLYGAFFSDIIGLEQLYKLPEVPAQQLRLNVDLKYPQQRALPSHMPHTSAVRGILGVQDRTPFVAVKIEVLDPTTKKVEAVVVEVIFKRYSLSEDNYVTALSNITEDGKIVPSVLYTGGAMSPIQITAVRELLEGKTIKAPIGKNLIRLAK